MPVKINHSSEEQIIAVALPNHGGKYAVIPHKTIIDKVNEEFKKHGFTVNTSTYKSTVTGNIANGIYHLNYGTDKDMALMFAWSNSYDKTQKFKCAVGASVFVCGNGMISGDMGAASRKHMGAEAQNDAFEFIEDQIKDAKTHYDNLVRHKEMLKKIIITKTTQAAIVGRMFIDDEILTLTQMGVVQRELNKPSHNYGGDPNSAWSLYNHLTFALKESHPTTYLDDHSKLHQFFVDEYGLLQTQPTVSKSATVELDFTASPVLEPVIPNQVTIHDVIAEEQAKGIASPEFQEKHAHKSDIRTVVFL